MQEKRRHYPAHREVDESGNRSTIIFVTVGTKDRKPILANPDSHHRLIQSWNAANHWRVGRYVVLPDHIHLFCAPSEQSPFPLRNWVAYWKSLFSRGWPRSGDKPLWQRDIWDRQLRRGESYDSKWEYVRDNPRRHGLVKKAEDWPYHGELNILEWHDA